MIDTDEIKKNFKENLNFLFPNENLDTIAKELEVSKSKVHNWKQEKSLPTIGDLKKVSDLSGKNLKFNDLLLSKLAEAYLPEDHQLDQYTGSFYMYYYDSNSAADKTNEKRDLRCGMAFVYKENNKLRVDALMGIMESNLSDFRPKENYEDFMSEAKRFANDYNLSGRYEGNVEITKSEIYINLYFGNHDQAKIILPNPPNIKEKKSYIGGLGTINSVSEGVLHEPCIGFIGLSRFRLEAFEASRHLIFKKNNINLRNEGERIVELLDYLNSIGENSLLGKDEKTIIVTSSLEKIVEGWLEKHIYTYGKVDKERDGNWYLMVKRTSYGSNQNSNDPNQNSEGIKYYEYEPRQWN
ncbi:hypothetical protein JZO70_09035 [Enterococcus sp. 669A]|uniref:HTH cro/C1-type domain-containing protein n=1 Tax=Candidatus Enterococcus moelleringii TaxID=2815325 RepID=A0ABS3LBB3_9ENTE|nr:hypothetical protein [Enterococcus sp. 669A]MBO1306303.1 hypothetical protein [Enterococcus sp. 669A]